MYDWSNLESIHLWMVGCIWLKMWWYERKLVFQIFSLSMNECKFIDLGITIWYESEGSINVTECN